MGCSYVFWGLFGKRFPTLRDAPTIRRLLNQLGEILKTIARFGVAPLPRV